MNNLYVYLINKTIKSPYFKSWVLAQVRHIITAAGATAIAKGYADQSMIEGILGFATTAAGFYLANLDVKSVDGKIKIALGTEPPSDDLTGNTVKTIPVEVHVLAPVERLPDVK